MTIKGPAARPAPQFHKFKVRTDCSQMSLQGEGDQASDPVAAEDHRGAVARRLAPALARRQNSRRLQSPVTLTAKLSFTSTQATTRPKPCKPRC
jgi:hypothetical protein